MLFRIFPWLAGFLLGNVIFVLVGMGIIHFQHYQPDITIASQALPDQSQVDQMVIASFNNPEVQNALKVFILSLMRTPEMRAAVVEMAHTPEMATALTDVMRTPEAQRAMISNMQSPEMRQYIYDMIPVLLAASFQESEHTSLTRDQN
jgi:hypothetical protein